MRIFLPCWGDSHISLFENCLAKSLLWPENNKAISQAEWCVVTEDEKSIIKIEEIIKKIDPLYKLTPIIQDHIKYDTPAALLKALKSVIAMCLMDNQGLLMATPDYIYGDGTIEALKLFGKDEGSCVAFAHMRVLPRVLDEMEGPLDNGALTISGAFYAHKSWIDSELGAVPGRTFHGGISWQRLSGDLIAVRHRLPAPFYVNFIPDDLEFFTKNHHHPFTNTFNLWDHFWPSELIKSKRFRYLGSSDLAAMIEVTNEDQNIPPANPIGKSNADGYVGSNFCNNTCEQFIYSMRT